MSFFRINRKKKCKSWDGLFSDITEQDIKQSKIMVYYCLHYTEQIPKETKILSSMTTGQYRESIAFFKTYIFHLVDISPIHHNLFYGYNVLLIIIIFALFLI